MLRIVPCCFLVGLFVSPTFGQNNPPKPKLLPSNLDDAEQAFVDQLQNKTLVGKSSYDGRPNEQPQQDSYQIGVVKKLQGSDWLVNARFDASGENVDIPVPVKVHWAGDTPVLSITDVNLPGIGAGFSARVLFYRDRYVGTWDHGDEGGHLWGTIESEKSQSRARQRIQAQLDARGDVDFEDAPLSAVARYLSDAHKISIVLADNVDGKTAINTNIKDTPLKKALTQMLKPHGLRYRIDGDVLRISQKSGEKQNADEQGNKQKSTARKGDGNRSDGSSSDVREVSK